MGGKTSTSTSQVQIPPEVLARYNSVNTTAQNVAQTPFQQYSTNPNAFVAPITPTQQYGIQNTNAAAGEAQPYYGAATGFALAGSQAVNPSQVDAGAINRYENPYLQQVLGATSAQINQNNQQAQAGQTGSAINQGYFGGDRSGIASAVLQGQQNLAAGQVYSGIESDAYQQALAAAQQQQGVGLAAAQANRAATQQTGQTLAELGTGAQGAALSGAQAQLGAGQVQQQTTQAGDTALYNQFLQQQSYPFQTAQFLANIAEGTGALSGNTTTSTTPGGLFSDERLKEDMEPIGKGFDGANIYRFRYKGDPTTRIGFSAQEVERKHPEAVSEHQGFKAVDYGAATEDAARRGGFANAANDDFHEERRARQAGGMSGWGSYPPGVNPMSIGELLQAQAQMYGPGFGGAGLYGGSASSMPHGGSSYVPAPMQGSPMMIHGTTPPQRPQANPLHAAAQLGQDATGLQTDVHDAHQAYDWLKAPTQGQFLQNVVQNAATPDAGTVPFARGGFARAHRQDGGGFDPSDSQNDNPYQVHGGPGLNIPTADTQHPQLQTAKPPAPGGGGSGLSSLLGDASDIAGIAKAAPAIGSLASGIGTGIAGAAGGIGSTLASLLPLLALARGGRARFAAGGALDSLRGDLEGGDNDPEEDALLRQALAPPDSGLAAATAPGSPAGGPGGPDAPPAGFEGAKPPGGPPEAAAAGFAGAKPGGTLGHMETLEGTAPNPHSSAIGVGQLLDGTYMGLLREAHPDVAAQVGNDPAAIKAFRRTPRGLALSAELAPMNQNKNRALMEHQGIPVTPTNEHVMWILGAGDGPKVLHADPATPLKGLITDAAIRANPSIMAGKTVGDFLGWARKGMNRGGFAGARHGYATDGLVVDPDAIDPTGGQADQLPAAPQVDPSLVEQAKQAATDPVVKQKVVENRVAAAQGDPSAPPAAQAAVANGPDNSVGRAAATGFQNLTGGGFLPTDQTQGAGAPAAQAPPQSANDGVDLDQAAQQRRLSQQYLAGEIQRQRGPQGGGFLGMLQRNWIPLMEGAAAWSGAPTQHPLVALLQGAGAFAQGEQGQRQYQLGQAEKLAELSQTGENVEAGAYGQQTQRIPAVMGAMSTVMPAFEQTFPPTGTTVGGEATYYDRRQGHAPGATITETQRNAMLNNIRLGMIAGAFPGSQGASGGLSGLVRPLYSTIAPAGNAPAAPPTTGGPPSGRIGDNGAGLPGVAPPLVGGGGPPAGALGTGSGPGAGGGADRSGHRDFQALGPQASLSAGLAHGDYQQPTALQQPSSDGLDPDWDPIALTTKGTTEQARGMPEGEVLLQRATDIRDGNQPARHPDGTPDDRWQQYQQRVEANKTNVAQNAQMFTQHNVEATNFAATYPQQSQILGSLINVLKSNDPEGMTPQIESILGRARSIPWLNAQLGPELKRFDDAGGVLDKEGARLALNGLSGALLNGAPATGLGQTNRTVPDYTKGAGAKFRLVGELGGLLARQHQYFQDWSANKDHVGPAGRVSDYDTKWGQENSIDAYDRGAFEKIPYFAGMDADAKAQFPRHPQTPEAAAKLPPGTPYYRKGDPEDAKHLRWTT